jgi:cytochrome c-type biogenesis protein CcmH
VIAVALFIPAGAALVYDRIGTPDAVGLDEHELRGEFSPGKLDDAIARLTARTAANPADGEGWAMLAEAQRMKGDLPAAARAYERANAVLPSPSARLLADHADVLVALAGGEFMPEALALLDRALAADPRDVKTLAMLGAARYRQGRLAEALALLRQLREVLPADSGQADAMAPVIARLEAELGQGAGAQDAGKPGAQAAGAAPAASASGRVIAGRIEIDPALAARLPPGTTLFIAARPAEGPRMPLAVRRLAPERFPVDFELGDGDLMTPGAAAWTQGAVVVEARLSRSGQALRASGDLYGTSRTVSGAARDLTIRIDQVVP